MTINAASKKAIRVSILGAVLAALFGLLLWATSLGDGLVNGSYDTLFRFGSPAVTNQVTLILMDNVAFDAFHQTRGQPWDRALHAQLLNRLADDGCPLVVFDSFFEKPRDPRINNALAGAMGRLNHIVLAARQSQVATRQTDGVQSVPLADIFLEATKTNWGVAWFSSDLDTVVRRQWPFPSPGPYPTFPGTAARLAGAGSSGESRERWLRYYGETGKWESMSYGYALTEPAGYFRHRTVFIGTEPEKSLPASGTEEDHDKFNTPYTAWTGEASGGVEINLTEFLNLTNDQSLVRPPWWLEGSTLALTGVVLGGGLCRLRRRTATLITLALFATVSLAGISLSFCTNYWVPWLIVTGGQLPLGLAWTFATRIRRIQVPILATGTASAPGMEPTPETPGYELIHPPFAEGAYGKVWLALSSAGTWRALKVIYQSKFGEDTAPYEREFNGVQKYQTISHKYPGLLRVDFVSKKKDGCFYYVMELGDALNPGWQQSPLEYKPRDLVSVRAQLRGRRLPVKECAKIGITLCQSLEFLHQHGMTHRDIKPQNIIYVDGQPKLADLGLISGIRAPGQEGTLVGTPGYMPPLPERPGTVAADIYAMGMVLYVASTGRQPGLFPEVATTLVSAEAPPDFWPLNGVILKACQPVAEDRYRSAAELGGALEDALKTIEGMDTASR